MFSRVSFIIGAVFLLSSCNRRVPACSDPESKELIKETALDTRIGDLKNDKAASALFDFSRSEVEVNDVATNRMTADTAFCSARVRVNVFYSEDMKKKLGDKNAYPINPTKYIEYELRVNSVGELHVSVRGLD